MTNFYNSYKADLPMKSRPRLANNYYDPPGIPEDLQALERKNKKPKMEKFRRDRMNLALEKCKAFVVKNQLAETSKLEKADILEKTADLLDRFDSGALIPAKSHQLSVLGYLRAFFGWLAKKQPSFAVEVEKVMHDFQESCQPMSGHHQMPQQQPNRMFMRPPMIQHVIPQQHQPVFPPGAPIPPHFIQQYHQLLQHQQQMRALGLPLMTSTPKTHRTDNPVHSVPSTVSTPVSASKDSSRNTKSVDSRPTSASSVNTEDEEVIDVENLDENDSTFSPPATPTRKRKCSNDTETDDSGVSTTIEPTAKRVKPFSIDGLL